MRTKAILVVLFVAFKAVSVLAQAGVYHPFPESNAFWSQEYWYQEGGSGPCTVYNDYSLYISGDSIVGALRYIKMYQNGNEYASCPPPGWYYHSPNPTCEFRQDSANKKVNLLIGGKDSLAYDFSLKVGDTLKPSYIVRDNQHIITSIDSIQIGKSFHKRFWFVNPYGSEFLIEGIGNVYGAFAPLERPFESGNKLFCVSINNQEVFPPSSSNSCSFYTGINEVHNSFNISLYPNPSDGIFTINSTSPARQLLQIFDINSRLIQTQPLFSSATIDASALSPGIYSVRISSDAGVENKRVVVVR